MNADEMSAALERHVEAVEAHGKIIAESLGRLCRAVDDAAVGLHRIADAIAAHRTA